MDHVGSRKRSRSRSWSRGQRRSEKRSKKSSKDGSRNCSASKSQGHKASSTSCIEERSKHKARRTSRSSSSSSSMSSSSSSTSSSSSSDGRKKLAKHREKKKRKKKKKWKKLNRRGKEKAVVVHQAEALPGPLLDQWHRSAGEDNDGPVLTDEQKSRIQAMKPMTKEECDARQSVIRKVVDPETGRTRLIKGDGEVLEEIVTKEQHRDQQASHLRGWPGLPDASGPAPLRALSSQLCELVLVPFLTAQCPLGYSGWPKHRIGQRSVTIK